LACEELGEGVLDIVGVAWGGGVGAVVDGAVVGEGLVWVDDVHVWGAFSAVGFADFA